MDDIYEFIKQFGARLDETEEVRTSFLYLWGLFLLFNACASVLLLHKNVHADSRQCSCSLTAVDYT